MIKETEEYEIAYQEMIMDLIFQGRVELASKLILNKIIEEIQMIEVDKSFNIVSKNPIPMTLFYINLIKMGIVPSTLQNDK